ncbi:hypothetical protein BD560DRAFT_54919 [Blakeslea trispora]|nr:hypothetical protein BD560DRAFT_54919 [Blakeslea trispora]
MAQPTTATSTHVFPLAEPQTLLERRQQSAPYLQQLELPSLPSLSHLLTEQPKTGTKEDQMTKAATEAALAAATAVTASMITTTAQPLIQHNTHPVSFLPQTSSVITAAPTNLLYNHNSYTNQTHGRSSRDGDSIAAAAAAAAAVAAAAVDDPAAVVAASTAALFPSNDNSNNNSNNNPIHPLHSISHTQSMATSNSLSTSSLLIPTTATNTNFKSSGPGNDGEPSRIYGPTASTYYV